MLLGAKQSVEDFIIQILAQHGDYTAEDLQAIIEEQWKQRISIQGIYRVLRKLYSDGIVVKQRRFYSLRIPWILHISEMVDRMEDTYLKESFLVRYLPKHSSESYKWIFTSLPKLSDFYTQLLLAAVHNNPTSIVYQYYPHPCFSLPDLQHNRYVHSHVLERIQTNYVFIKGTSFLDKYTTADWELFHNLFYVHHKEGTPHIETHLGKYIAIVDPFIIFITFDPHTTRRIESFYESVHSVSDLKFDSIINFCVQKIRARVSIQQNHELVEKYKKKFKRVFPQFSLQ